MGTKPVRLGVKPVRLGVKPVRLGVKLPGLRIEPPAGSWFVLGRNQSQVVLELTSQFGELALVCLPHLVERFQLQRDFSDRL